MVFELSRLETLHREGYNRIRIEPAGDEKEPRILIKAESSYDARVTPIEEEVPGRYEILISTLIATLSGASWRMEESDKAGKSGWRGSCSHSIPPPSRSKPNQRPTGTLIKPSR